MRLITKKEHLLKNVEKVEYYLTTGTLDEKKAIGDLIRKGRNLLAYQVDKELRFAPSRFLGYVDNDLVKHASAKSKHQVDGRDTTPEITRILAQRRIESTQLDKKYILYCTSLGLMSSDAKRTFWHISLKEDFRDNELLEGEFPEGKIIERIHKSRERNSKVVELAKANFKKQYKRLFCQVCAFDFEKEYGEIGKDFIEGHHTIAVSDMKEGHITKPEDIALLCGNCHRMVHKKRPWLSMGQLNSLLKKKKK